MNKHDVIRELEPMQAQIDGDKLNILFTLEPRITLVDWLLSTIIKKKDDTHYAAFSDDHLHLYKYRNSVFSDPKCLSQEKISLADSNFSNCNLDKKGYLTFTIDTNGKSREVRAVTNFLRGPDNTMFYGDEYFPRIKAMHDEAIAYIKSRSNN